MTRARARREYQEKPNRAVGALEPASAAPSARICHRRVVAKAVAGERQANPETRVTNDVGCAAAICGFGRNVVRPNEFDASTIRMMVLLTHFEDLCACSFFPCSLTFLEFDASSLRSVGSLNSRLHSGVSQNVALLT